MREIDFIPQWHTNSRRLRVRYRRQCVLIGCLVGGMVVGSLALGLSVAHGQEAVDRTSHTRQAYELIKQRHDQVRSQYTQLMDMRRTLDALDPGIRLAAVLAELTRLVPDRVMVAKLHVTAEPVSAPGARTKLVLTAGEGEDNSLLRQTEQFKVVVSGLAADPECVTRLVAALEESDYFCRASPGLLRNKTVGDRVVTEFEIACYLANSASTGKES